MQFRKLSAIFLLFLTSFAAYGAALAKSELESMYDKAFQAFDAANYDEALTALDAIDARQPDLAESLNLRGVVYMREGKYDKAEATLRKALSIEPKFWNASFNLAEIAFLKKDWAEARNRFEALIAGENEGMQPEMSQLIQYKILLSFVLQGKENMVDWILNQFELAKDSPALYYSNAAIALQHGNQKEAAEWISAAKKHFAARLNDLFAESFYEIGWMQRPAGEAPAALITSAAERAERLKTDAKANFEKAERAFEQRDIDAALKFLDLTEAGAPDDAASDNLRGEILMDQGKFDEAEVVLRKAFTANPRFREAQYNLAQIPFKRGEYAKSRDRFEALFSETPGDEKNQAAQLIKFKIFLTFLLENKESEARQLMDQFKFTGDSPALDHAQSAWEFNHGNPDRGNDWIASAQKIYSPALNLIFVDSLYDAGWLKRPEGKTPPIAAAIEQASSPLATEPKPAMRLGLADAPPVPLDAPGTTANSAAAHTTQTASSEAQTTSIPTGPATTVVAPSPTAHARPNNAPAKLPSTPVGKPPVSVSAASANAPAATAFARFRQRLQPVFAGTLDHLPSPRTLLVGFLLVAGILLLVWSIVQFLHRNLPPGLIQGSPVPLTEPPLAGEISEESDEQKISSNLLNYGPPKLSLQLQARETSVDPTALPSVAANGDALGIEELLTDIPETGSEALYSEPAASEEESISVEQEAVLETSRPYDSEEVSRAAAEPAALTTRPEVVATEIEMPLAIAETTWPMTDLEKGQETPQSTAAALAPIEEEPVARDESVGQGQPIPQLTAAPFMEPALSEPTQPETEFTAVSVSREVAAAETTAGWDTAHSAAEPLSFPSMTIATEPISQQSTTPNIMQEMTFTPPPAASAFSPTMPAQRPAGTMRTAVQLTFSLEIGSMQLTPTFEMRDLQLKPTSRIVTMRLAPCQAPHPPIDLQITFEIAKIELEGETIRTVRLVPSTQEKPAVISSSSFAVARLELEPNSGIASVQLTPSHQAGASVHLTAGFQISTIEFSPGFGIAAIVLNSTSRNVSLQLPGAEPTIEDAPVFAIERVEMNGSQLGLIQVTQLGSGHL